MKTKWIRLVFLAAFSLAGCGAPAQPATPSPLDVQPQGVPPIVEPSSPPGESMELAGTPTFAPSTTPDPGMEQMIEKSVDDLAAYLGIDASQVSVSKVAAITWPDASLGCPQTGISYAQVLTPGYRIELSAAGGTYIYHTDSAEVIIPCENGDESNFPIIPLTPGEIQDGQPWVPVK